MRRDWIEPLLDLADTVVLGSPPALALLLVLGVRHTAETCGYQPRAQLLDVDVLILMFQLQHHNRPPSQAGLTPLLPEGRWPTDGWGTPLRYTVHAGTGAYELRSLGPDRVPGADDIVHPEREPGFSGDTKGW